MTSRSWLLMLALALSQSPADADTVVLVAGGGEGPDGGPAVGAKVVQPFAVDFAPDGGILFVEMVGGERLRRIGPDGRLTTLAGTGKKESPGRDGPADQATFNGMHNLLVAPDGLVYLADTFNGRVRKYDPNTRTVAPFAGTGGKGFSGDGGPAAKATFGQTICIAFGPGAKVMYICDITTGVVTTVAGNGQKGEPKDGEPAASQPLIDPRAVACDDKGHLYVLERNGHRLRVVRPDGTIRTVAGTGKKGIGGDGGPALQASFNGPKFLACCRDGSVLIADTENHQIRRYIPGREIVELVAGTGQAGKAGLGGDPKQLQMARPHGVSEHPTTGELYIADSENGRVLKIVKD
jgi:DNA-binding beta-propeller fold protein YncE